MYKKAEYIPELKAMKTYPKDVFYAGNPDLLNSTKISIVGTRKPCQYSRNMTHLLASSLSKHDICVVSGGAMGIDAVAHMGAGSKHTIAVLPCGMDHKYPAVNKKMLLDIQNKGLLLSQFKHAFKAASWSFVVRNELVVALGDVLVVAEAELGSGSMRSIEFALNMGKEIYVFPHRIGESSATNSLLQDAKAKVIYDIDLFVSQFSSAEISEIPIADEFIIYCKTVPSYDDALKKFPLRTFESELSGEIEVKNGKVFLR
ncbi:DNA-protecting protein DprA [bacterium]|nr:DNA-protecting protein DprA [bacterium]MBU1989598.1 DNA-protecting protein DprA [bacterium]